MSQQSLSNTRNEEHIGLIDFNVYDGNDEPLSSSQYEVKRSITYQDGKTEEWATGDIGTAKNFKGATMYLTEYVIIEKKENLDSIKIVPVERKVTPYGEEEKTILGEMNVKLD